MSVGERLSHALDCRDQGPNKKLAQDIVINADHKLLQELVEFLESKPKKGLQMDCAVTLAYVGEQKPEMLVPHADSLTSKMSDPINRVIWGSMMALAHMAHLIPKKLFESLPPILDAMDAGTVVTRDYGFRILTSLYQQKEMSDDLLHIIIEQLAKAPGNQLGQYTERFAMVVLVEHKKLFIETLEERMQDLTNEHHRKRLTKNLKKLYK